MKLDFTNKVALVTGGTSGIGRATAIAFARAGAKVVISGRRKPEGDAVAAEIAALGGTAKFIQGDVAKEEDAENLVAETVKAFGRLDCAFNNAGVETDTAPIAETSTASYDKVFDVNVRGLFFCMRSQIAQMLKNGGGSIVSNSSVGGLIALGGVGAYVASKHAVIGFTKTAALENAKLGIRVNAVCPGAVQTEMMDRFVGTAEQATDMRKGLEAMHPVGRLGTSDEIAAAVLFLCSNVASFITGVALPVDGGFTAQ